LIDKLYQLINEAAKRLGPNWTIVFANQNIPRPVKPYISINVLSVDIPGHVIYSPMYAIGPEQHDGHSTMATTISGWRKAEVELQVFNGINSLSTINTLALILQTPSVLDYQQEIDCAIGNRLFIGYVPELISLSQYEGRGIYQFEFMYTEEYTETMNEICSVIVNGRYVAGAVTPDPYVIFNEQNVPVNSLTCVETVPCPDEVDSDWDDGETGWDRNQTTEWDNKI